MLPMLLQESSSSGTQWPDALIASAGIAMVTAITVVVIWQFFVSWRARVSAAREDAYRDLSARFASTQEQLVVDQGRVAADLSEVKARIENVERILREVE